MNRAGDARASARAITERVRLLYERHPYPSLAEIERPLDARFHLDRLNYLLHRRPGEGDFGEEIRIWVAGCGSDHAVEVAMRFPRASVLATDVSKKALDLTKRLARELSLPNLEATREDILEAPHRSAFDLVVCVGVLHHLADPSRAFRAIRRSLRPGGAALVVVYNEVHRREVRAFQTALRHLCSSDAIAARSRAARHLLSALSAGGCEPLGSFSQGLERGLAAGRVRPAAVFDTLIHPREVAYSIEDFLEEIAAAKLRLATWRWPVHWDLANYLSDPDVLRRFYRLDPPDQFSLVCALAGSQAPLFDCWLERADSQPWRRFTHRELSRMRPRYLTGATVHSVESGRIGASRTRRFDPKSLGSSVTFEGRIRTEWELPPCTQRVLERCDGRTSIGELCGLAPDEPVLELLELLLSPEIELLAPT